MNTLKRANTYAEHDGMPFPAEAPSTKAANGDEKPDDTHEHDDLKHVGTSASAALEGPLTPNKKVHVNSAVEIEDKRSAGLPRGGLEFDGFVSAAQHAIAAMIPDER